MFVIEMKVKLYEGIEIGLRFKVYIIAVKNMTCQKVHDRHFIQLFNKELQHKSVFAYDHLMMLTRHGAIRT